MNWQRGSYEMILAWRQKGQAKTELLRKWMQNPDVASITAEMVFTEQFAEPAPEFHTDAQLCVYDKHACMQHLNLEPLEAL